MPHISLSLYKGRSREQLQQMSKDLQQCLMENYGWKPEDISVSVESIDAEGFDVKVREKMKNEEIYIPSAIIK